MPFRSKKQKAYMMKNLPTLAKKWMKEYGGKIMPHKKKMMMKKK